MNTIAIWDRIGAAPPRRADYVYVASSWRNDTQPVLCEALAGIGIDHYDFRNPPGGTGFSWRQVRTNHLVRTGQPGLEPSDFPGTTVKAKGADWEPADDYVAMVSHPVAVAGYQSDFEAMQRADTFVLVLPCGKSAHLELGWAAGAGKRTAILLEDPVEPELMYRMVDFMTSSVPVLLAWLAGEA